MIKIKPMKTDKNRFKGDLVFGGYAARQTKKFRYFVKITWVGIAHTTRSVSGSR